MRSITKISFPEKNQILCDFDNGETRLLDLSSILKDKYGQKLPKENLYSEANLGVFEEIFWEKFGEIKNLNGEIEPCDCDISPDFAYYHSTPESE